MVPVDAIIGSNIANVLIVIGLASIWARSIKVTNKLIESDIPLLCMFTGVFVIFLYTDRVITRPEAYVSLLLFIVFLSYSIVTRSKHIFFTGHRPTFSHRDIAILV